MRQYDHLYFDLDHTLWDFGTNSRLAMQKTVAEMGLDKLIPDFDRFFAYYETINTKLWAAYRKQEIRKQELIRKRFEDTLNYFNITTVDPLAMNDHYLKLMPVQKQLYPNVLDVLDYLKQKGYQMHIITNGFTEVQHRKIESSGLAPYFKRIFISEEVQAPKPDKRIFQHALSSCNARKKKSLMIGDSWEADILGAKNAGINQVLVLHNTHPQTTPPAKEWGEEKEHYFQNISPSTTTYIVSGIEKLSKLL
ncbi:YjjG family noncanonical pyrimidine nucleotidase [uncultured Sunxiuqinia sp.]|uniref:YjjG family noncanonical pyrimidine nucleotidase n=1 Tax=uncultured Sunxiuqinia sp. TaxID=1573825 RepID=UPI0026111FD1|nr:YjjG family noncanonical pyrimidine nucleotidase [uncultured Sunxiuqinia sp.]